MDTTHGIPQPVAFKVPNLDCMPPMQRASYMTAVYNSTVDETLKTLILTYCAFKAVAETSRLAGRIGDAMSLERVCDALHRQFPEWARW